MCIENQRKKPLFNPVLIGETVTDVVIQDIATIGAYITALGTFDDHFFDDKSSDSEKKTFHIACGIVSGLLYTNIIKKAVLFGIGNKMEKNKQEQLLEKSTDVESATKPKKKAIFNSAFASEAIADTLVQLGIGIIAYLAGCGVFDNHISKSGNDALHIACGVMSGLLFLNLAKKAVLLGVGSKIEKNRQEQLLKYIEKAQGEKMLAGRENAIELK